MMVCAEAAFLAIRQATAASPPPDSRLGNQTVTPGKVSHFSSNCFSSQRQLTTFSTKSNGK